MPNFPASLIVDDPISPTPVLNDRAKNFGHFTRTARGEFTGAEENAAAASPDPGMFKKRLALSFHMSALLGKRPIDIHSSFDKYHQLLFEHDNISKSFSSVLDNSSIVEDTSDTVVPLAEVSKSVARTLGSFAIGTAQQAVNIAGSALEAGISKESLVGQDLERLGLRNFDDEVAMISRFNRQFQKDFAAHPQVLRDFMEVSGSIDQLGSSAFYMTRGPELITTMLAVFATSAPVFKLSQLLFKGKALASTALTLETLAVGESLIEGAETFNEVQAGEQDKVFNSMLKIIDGMSKEEQESIRGRAIIRGAQQYMATIHEAGDPSIAGDAANQVFRRTLAILTVGNLLGGGAGVVSGKLLLKAIQGKSLATAIKSAAGFIFASAVESETELKQKRETDSAVSEALTGRAIDINYLNFETLDTLSSGNKEDFDIMLGSWLMGLRSGVAGFAYDVSQARSYHAADTKIKNVIKQVDDDKAEGKTIPPEIGTMVDKLKKAETLEEQATIYNTAAEKHRKRIETEFRKERELAEERARIEVDKSTEGIGLSKELARIDETLEAAGEGVIKIDTPVTADKIRKDLETLGVKNVSVTVIDTVTDLSESDQSKIPARAEGFFSNGKVFIIADRVDKSRVRPVLLHETFHGGLNLTKNKAAKDKLLDSIFSAFTPEQITSLSERYDADLSTPEKRRIEAEEFLARVAEDGKADPNLIQRILAAVRQYFRDLGAKLKLSENDIRSIIARSLQATKGETQDANTRTKGQSAQTKEADSETQTPQRQKAQVNELEIPPNVAVSRTQAKKRPDGKWQLFWRGTLNNIFPDELFNSAAEAKQFFKVRQIKQAQERQEGEVRFSVVPSDRFFRKHEELRKRRTEILARQKELRELTGNALTVEAAKRLKRRVAEKSAELKAVLTDTAFADEIKRVKQELNDKFKAFLADNNELKKAIETYMTEQEIDTDIRASVISSLRVLGQLKTRAAKEKKLTAIVNSLAASQERRNARNLRKKILATIKGILKPRKKGKGVLIGPTAGPEAVEKVTVIDKLTKLSFAVYEKRSAELKGVLAEAMDQLDINHEVLAGIQFEQVQLEAFANLENKDSATLASSLEMLQSIIANEKTLYDQIKEEQAQSDAELQFTIIDEVGGVPSEADWKNRLTKPKTALQVTVDNIIDFKNKSFSLTQILDKVADVDKSGRLEEIMKMWRRFFHDANQKERSTNREDVAQLYRDVALMFDLTEKTGKRATVLQTTQDQAKTLIANFSTTYVEGVTLESEVRHKDKGERSAPLILTVDQALYLHLAMQMPDLSDNFEKNGFDNTTRQQLDAALTEDQKAYGEYLVDRLDSEWSKTNNFYRRIFGINMARLESYFPFRTDRTDIFDSGGEALNSAEMNYSTMFTPGSMIARKHHNLSVQTKDGATALFHQHLLEINKFRAYAIEAREFFAVMKDREVQRALRFRLGDDFINLLMEFATQTVNGGNPKFARNKGWDYARSVYIYKVFFGNTKVFFTQVSSFAGYWKDMGTVEFIKTLATSFTEEGRKEIETILATDFVQNRWEQGSDIEVMFILRQGRKPNGWKTLRAAGMLGLRIGDLIPIVVAGRGVYFNAFREGKRIGLSDAQAHKEAELVFGMLTESMQQSSAWKDRTYWQRQGSMQTVASLFQQTPRQYMTVGTRAIEKFYHNRSRDAQVKAIFTVFVLLPAVFTFVQNFYRFKILGEDDDRETQEILLQYIIAMALAPVNGLWIIGKIVQAETEKIFLGGYPFSDTISIFSLVDDVQYLAKAAWGVRPWPAEDRELREVLDNLGRVFPVVKQPTKAIENRIED